MKKITLTTTLFLLMMMATHVFAANEVTMEIVENNICSIDLAENCLFEKKIVDSNLKNHQVTLQLKITNNNEVIVPSGELMLVIDSSESMDTVVDGTTTRKDLVLNSANTLVKNLLAANPSSLKIGVVTFSTSSKKNEDGFFITGTEADAQKVCDFTNDFSVLSNKISSIEGTGQYTNLDSGLQLASKQFTSKASHKYMIILTDGLPNIAIGYNDLVSYDGLLDVMNQTKSTLTSLNDVDVFTMLTGIDNEQATFRTNGTDTYTYGQVIQNVFGSETAPTKGKFYKINDSEIENTITNKIYHDLLPIEKSLENISIIDYIPQYIADNFDISITKDSAEFSAIISEDNRTITWNIDTLAPGESKFLKFDLILKNTFDESIINKILDTNEKVDVNYSNFDGENEQKTSNVTPKIRLTAVSQPIADTTIAQNPIPKAGSPIFTITFIVVLGLAIFFGYKAIV